MPRTLDIITGAVIGGLIWAILDFILSPIPILGWIIAAILAGYVAGRLGGWWAGLILALFTPVASFVVGESVLKSVSGFINSNIPAMAPIWNMASQALGAFIGGLALIQALINLMFVGFGASLGASAYNKSKNKEAQNRAQSSNVRRSRIQGASRLAQVNPIYSLSELDRYIVERFRAGIPLDQIARETNINIFDLQNKLIDLMNRGLVAIQLNQLEIQILEAAKSGIDIRKIAEQTGVSEEFINMEIWKLRAMTLLDQNFKLTPLGYHLLVRQSAK